MRFIFSTVLYFALLMSPALSDTFQDIARKADRGIGRVIIPGFGSGSGFVISMAPNGRDFFMVTNRHVVGTAKRAIVGFGQPNSVIKYKAEVVVRDPTVDLAVLRVRVPSGGSHKPTILPISTFLLQKGENVFSLGFPGVSLEYVGEQNSPDEFETTLTRGNVSKLSTGSWIDQKRLIEVVQHTASINPGNSGGALLDMCGRVVGVNTERLKNSPDVNLSSAASVITKYLSQSDIPFSSISKACDPTAASQASAPLNNIGLPFWVLLGVAGATVLGGAGFYAFRTNSAKQGSNRNQNRNRNNQRRRNHPAAAKPAKTAALMLNVTLPDNSTESFPISSEELRRGATIGRSDSATIQISAVGLSREHARLSLKDRRLELTDLGSTNGTKVDGKSLAAQKPTQINTASKLAIGPLSAQVAKVGD